MRPARESRKVADIAHRTINARRRIIGPETARRGCIDANVAEPAAAEQR